MSVTDKINTSGVKVTTNPPQSRWTKYVHEVAIRDRGFPLGSLPHEPPVTVAGRILFDGEPVDARVNPGETYSIEGSARDGMVVTLLVHEDDVQIGVVNPDGTLAREWRIGGRSVLVPKEHNVAAEDVWERDLPMGSREWPWIRCRFYVGRVVIG